MWADTASYDATARRLATLFRDNFKNYQPGVGASITVAGPA
jgi:phosphoenolpyruvate carboxykinase (ATP)